jgi:Holliday junction resolvase RusA-like endonuclease
MEGRDAYVPILTFTVLGRPVPQGSVRNLGKGRPSIHGNADDLIPWRNQVQLAAEQAIRTVQGADSLLDRLLASDSEPVFPVLDPVSVVCNFTWPKPAAAPKRRKTYPVSRPDSDKLARAILDSLGFAGVYKDDSQVIDLRSTKSYPNEGPWALHVPGVKVTVYRIVWMEEEE